MNLSEIEKIMTDSGASLCIVCGLPFEKRNSRQKTCGSASCQRIAHNEYLRERARRLKAEDPVGFNKRRAAANKKWRNKIKALNEREKELKKLNNRWERQLEFDKKIGEYGLRYGEVSAQKTLAKVPKIDVNLERRKGDDSVHIKDDTE